MRVVVRENSHFFKHYSNMNLHEESLYLQGARDILMRLKDAWEMYLIPSIKVQCKPSEFLPDGKNHAWFPLANTKIRRILGSAMYDALLQDRQTLKRVLQGETSIIVKHVAADKKGKITRLVIEVKD